MKLLLIISFAFFLLIGCDDGTPNNENQNEPVYEEFTTQENDVVEKQVEEVEDTVSNPQEFHVSLDNLNEFLASPEQVVIFSFKTESGKVLSLLTDANENYLIYRFGKPDKVELQYPEIADNTSWNKFTFQSYNTPTENLVHISFENIDTKYNIYFNENIKTPTDNKVGIQVILPNKTIDIRGDLKQITGNLTYFKDNDKVNK